MDCSENNIEEKLNKTKKTTNNNVNLIKMILTKMMMMFTKTTPIPKKRRQRILILIEKIKTQEEILMYILRKYRFRTKCGLIQRVKKF